MNTLTIILIIIAVIAVVALGWIGIYNRLIKQRNWVQEAFSQIDVQLQRRNDLIPNLVNTVKGYASHEKETLDAVTRARQQLVNITPNGSPTEINNASNELTSALSRLLAVSERYPELKANENFSRLQATLEDTEDKIAIARQLYNSTVVQYNNTVQTVPNNIVANVHHFETKATLEAPAEARQVPTVSFE